MIVAHLVSSRYDGTNGERDGVHDARCISARTAAVAREVGSVASGLRSRLMVDSESSAAMG